MVDISGGKYMSLPQYERCFQMPRISPTPTPSPEEDRYTRNEVMEIMKKAMVDHDKIMHLMNQTMYMFFFPL